MNHQEYREKENEVLNNFSKKFIEEKYYHSPLANHILNLLICGESPYLMIEIAIEQYIKLEKDFIESLNFKPAPTLIYEPPLTILEQIKIGQKVIDKRKRKKEFIKKYFGWLRIPIVKKI